MISIDGCRWDYPEKAETPNLDFLVETGVRARSLIPCFPTKTFPNHHSIVTGLYPDHHGIVASNMYDPETGDYFRLSIPDAIHDPKWWGGEPIWVTAEKQGLITAAYFWPGTSTPILGVLPSYYSVYDGGVPDSTRVLQVLDWLALPRGERPSFVTTYFSTLDEVGHDFSPESEEVRRTIAKMDSLIGVFLQGLKRLKMLNEVNIMIMSDHGMAQTSPSKIIFLDDYIALDSVDVVDWNPFPL